MNTDVLIVGAGPTGLMAANQLERFGIDFIIIDSKSGPTVESRAILVTSRSIEIYQQMGLSDQVVNNGKKVTSFNLFTNGKVRGEVQIGELGKEQSEFSYLLAFEQFKNEKLLSERLDNLGKSVLWEHEYLKMLEYENKVTAMVRHQGEEFVIEAKYIIGCEGAKSPIRHELDFSFRGGTYEQKFFVADTVMEAEIGSDKLIVSPGKENFVALMPETNAHTYRVLGTLPSKFNKKDDVTFNDIKETVKKTLNLQIDFKEVNWFSIYKLHHRAVDHFSEGRVFLAGDSAHIHSPAGGQGMNTGLQDAYNLCWKLAMVLKGQAPERLLRTYNEERMPFAKWLLKFTDRGFTFMSSRNIFIRVFRKLFGLPMAGILMKREKIRKLAFKTVSQIGWSYNEHSIAEDTSTPELEFYAGDRFPYFIQDNLYLKLTEPAFHLVHIGTNPLSEADWNGFKETFTGDLILVEDPIIEKWNSLGVTNELIILVRPDNYIAYIADGYDQQQLNEYLKKVGLKA
ncbi:MAG: FAD-dependent monooxygenase [Crocinitomicaceae bacterium]|nr:FAD-dependent monooxygenase [Crocinitomicaceae bacterium]